MKIILKEDVKNLGYEGDLAEVKDGYARNFLFPRGFAVEANKGNLAQWELEKEEREKRHAENLQAAEAMKARMEAESIQISAKAGEEGKLFGAVTSQDIADRLAEKGFEIDKKKIETENIKSLGKHEIPVRIFKDVIANLVLEVVEE